MDKTDYTTNSNYMNFWENIDALLDRHHITLKELSKETNIPYTTLYNQAKRISKPDISFVCSVAEQFNYPIEILLMGDIYEVDKPELDNEIELLIDSIKKPTTKNNNTINTHTAGLISIPFVQQKISAGYGEELLNPEDVEIQTINIMEDLARGIPRESLLAARVKGDSMIDIYIYPDDIVVFAKGIISGDGIYVLSIDNEVMVKRLVFDRLNHSVLIISENKKYPQWEAKDDNQSLRILGKVVGWIHANSV